MAKQEQLDILIQGVEMWNEWREEHPNIQPDLNGAYLNFANLSSANLDRANLFEANLSGANLSGASLKGANLLGVDLHDADLSGVDLSGADLSHAYIIEGPLNRPDLSGARLMRANLNGTDLHGVDLSRADLSGASLKGANLTVAELIAARLNKADLWKANLYHADLSRADLSGASLSGASLNGAILRGADLSLAIMSETVFANLDLRETKGLVEINHKSSSIVQLHTVLLPQDGSALHFLRGTGIPDEWINYWRTMVMHPVQYHSLFISYSSKDDLLARRLYADLQEKGVRCWFAPEDMKIGDKIRARIDEAIQVQEKLLLLLSEHAIASDWVEDEVEAALEKEHRQQREVLFPVRLDESVLQTSQAWAAKLRRTRHIGDFTLWAYPQAYQRAFERLLHDLKVATQGAEPREGTPNSGKL